MKERIERWMLCAIHMLNAEEVKKREMYELIHNWLSS